MQDIWRLIVAKFVEVTISDHVLYCGKMNHHAIMIDTYHEDHPHHKLSFVLFINTYDGQCGKCKVHSTTSTVFADKYEVLELYDSVQDAAQYIIAGMDLREIIASINAPSGTSYIKLQYSKTPGITFPPSHHIHTCIITAKLFAYHYERRHYLVSRRVLYTDALVSFVILYEHRDDKIAYDIEYYLTKRGCRIDLYTYNLDDIAIAGSTLQECLSRLFRYITSSIIREIIVNEFYRPKPLTSRKITSNSGLKF